jgi:hypothetical protein
MAIFFEQVDGWFRPRLVCDACQQPITEIADDDTSLTRVWHVHKSEVCQANGCRAAGHDGRNGMWDELANHIVMLAVDVGLFPAVFADQYEYLLRTDRVPAPPKEGA